LELSRIACFAAIPQLMLDAVFLKLAPFVELTGARNQCVGSVLRDVFRIPLPAVTVTLSERPTSADCSKPPPVATARPRTISCLSSTTVCASLPPRVSAIEENERDE
jgi:hypothetical protein